MSKEPKKNRGLSDEQWVKVREKFEQGAAVAALSREYDIRRATIAARAKREAWTVQPTVHMDSVTQKAVQQTAQAKVIDIASRRVIEQMEQSGALAEQVRAIDALLQMQVPLYAKAAKLIDATLDRAISGDLKLGVTQGETTALSDLLGALSKFSKDTRTGAGIREGTPTVGDAQVTDSRFEFVVDEKALEEARKLAG